MDNNNNDAQIQIETFSQRYCMQTIIFSKDRTFQCGNLLRSFNIFLQPGDGLTIDTTVVYKIQENQGDGFRLQGQYDKLIETFTTFSFIAEETQPEANSFEDALLKVLNQTDCSDPESQFIYFAVDDMFFYNYIDIRCVMAILQSDPEIYCFHSKLHPGICFCHTQGKPCPPPPFELPPSEAQPVLDGARLLQFTRADGCLDWNYPWDLSGSLYRKADVMSMIERIHANYGKGSITNPNVLENLGNKLCKSLDIPKKCLCLSTPAMSIITVNKVQDLFTTPVYACSTDLNQLNLMFDDYQLDVQEYRKHVYDSAHIGQLFLKPRELQSINQQDLGQRPFSNELDMNPILTALLPFHNEGKFLRQAVESILNQTFQHFRLVLIDDGSSDDSILSITDLINSDSRISLISHTEKQGLATSLNEGLESCSSPLVARMDADDVSHPSRFQKQVDYLMCHPDITVLGTGALLFSSLEGGEQLVSRVVCHPTNPALLGWSLLFSCNLSHPSVMFRREKIIEAGGYTYNHPHAEDYDLWSRLVFQHEGKIANLGEPLVSLRKHTNNTSLLNREQQKDSSLSIACASCEHLLGQPVGRNEVKAMRRPEESECFEDSIGAFQLILSCENAFFSLEQCAFDEELIGSNKQIVEFNASARIGELAVTSLAKYGSSSVTILSAWADRCPQQRLEIMQKLFLAK